MSGTENNISQEPTEKKKSKQYTVLGQKLGGGPHGVGDPNDKSLRKVEKDVLIMEKVRNISMTEKCPDVSKAFYECSKEAGLLFPFKCRPENSKLQECLAFWYENEELRERCTQEYLKERTEFRQTGIPSRKYNRVKKIMEPNVG